MRTAKELAVLTEGARIKLERLDGEITRAEADIVARTAAPEEPNSASSEESVPVQWVRHVPAEASA